MVLKRKRDMKKLDSEIESDLFYFLFAYFNVLVMCKDQTDGRFERTQVLHGCCRVCMETQKRNITFAQNMGGIYIHKSNK